MRTGTGTVNLRCNFRDKIRRELGGEPGAVYHVADYGPGVVVTGPADEDVTDLKVAKVIVSAMTDAHLHMLLAHVHEVARQSTEGGSE